MFSLSKSTIHHLTAHVSACSENFPELKEGKLALFTSQPFFLFCYGTKYLCTIPQLTEIRNELNNDQ